MSETESFDIQAVSVPMAGLGVDIVEIDRMEKILARSPMFARRNYSEAEQEYCEAHRRPAVRYATHFAAKEAVVKALGTGFSKGVCTTDVEVAHRENGRPYVILHGRAAEIAEELGIVEIPLSLSRTHETAVANAVAVTQASRPVQEEEELTPRQKLQQQFRELRGMLDDLESQLGEDEDEAEDEQQPSESSGDVILSAARSAESKDLTQPSDANGRSLDSGLAPSAQDDGKGSPDAVADESDAS